MTCFRKTYVDSRWGQVHLRVTQAPAGSTPPLVLLHPTPKSGWIFEPLLPLLGQDRTVLAPDTPGYGASDPPPAPASITDLAQVMLDVARDVVGDRPVDVLGYHTGSVIAVAMVLAAPDRVRRLVLTSLPVYGPHERFAKLAALADWPAPAPDGSHLAAMWALVLRLVDPRVDIDWTHASVVENLRCGRRAAWGYEAVYNYDLETALTRLSHPALVLVPHDDLYRQTLRGIALLRHARMEILRESSHGLFELDAATIAALVRGFLDG